MTDQSSIPEQFSLDEQRSPSEQRSLSEPLSSGEQLSLDDVDVRGVHLWLIVWKTYEALRQNAYKSIHSLRICFTDFAILEFLLHKGPSPVNVIGKTVAITSGSISVAIDRLVERGLVARCPHSTDRRTRVVSLTDSGSDLIVGAFERHCVAMEEATASVSAAERKILIPLLKRLGKEAKTKADAEARD